MVGGCLWSAISCHVTYECVVGCINVCEFDRSVGRRVEGGLLT